MTKDYIKVNWKKKVKEAGNNYSFTGEIVLPIDVIRGVTVEPLRSLDAKTALVEKIQENLDVFVGVISDDPVFVNGEEISVELTDQWSASILDVLTDNFFFEGLVYAIYPHLDGNQDFTLLDGLDPYLDVPIRMSEHFADLVKQNEVKESPEEKTRPKAILEEVADLLDEYKSFGAIDESVLRQLLDR